MAKTAKQPPTNVCGERRALIHLLAGKKAGTATMKTRVEGALNVRSKATTDPAVPLLGTCPEDQRSHCTHPRPVIFIAALLAQ